MSDSILSLLNQDRSLISLLILCEDFLDTHDLYAFMNWSKGEIFKGPDLRMYWVDFSLRYEFNDMPDPKGAARLASYGVMVEYKKIQEERYQDPSEIRNDASSGAGTMEPKPKDYDVWIVSLSIPRNYINYDLDKYNEMISSQSDLVMNNADAGGVSAKTENKFDLAVDINQG